VPTTLEQRQLIVIGSSVTVTFSITFFFQNAVLAFRNKKARSANGTLPLQHTCNDICVPTWSTKKVGSKNQIG
jgi:hypothetical protein